MGKGLIDMLADIIIELLDLNWTEEKTGRYGEKLTAQKLKLLKLLGYKGKILRNVYIPKDNGETSEIDLIFITQKGLFVIESKNYSGWIFGDFKSQYWTACLPNGDKNRFYNPVKQNYTHIKWLTNYLARYTAVDIPMYSTIVFSERCELKKIPCNIDRTVICRRNELNSFISRDWNYLPNIFTEQDVEITYNILVGLTNVSEAEKQAHITNIKNKFEPRPQKTPMVNETPAPQNYIVPPQNTVPLSPNTEPVSPTPETIPQTNEPLICPRCGSKLVLRTAKKGANIGNQFYGCSSFPKCRYIQNL